mmetsp:Transcript_17240/g.49836  ORF Transcript_17240/g.49836 Transcript_17240/m.49836 type:complete len:321 (+) Transcript_17240:1365-2327(+)
MLLHRQRVVGSTFHSGVVGDEEHLTAVHEADAGDDARGVRAAVVHVPCGERRQLQELGAGVDDRLDALAGQRLAALPMLIDGLLAAARAHQGEAVLQLSDQSLVVRLLPRKGVVAAHRRQLQRRGRRAAALPHALVRTVPNGGRVDTALLHCVDMPVAVHLTRLVRRHRGGIGVFHKRIEKAQLLAALHCLLRGNGHTTHDAVRWCVHLSLQLHGRQEQQDVPALHLCALRRDHLDHRGLDRRRDGQLLAAQVFGRRLRGLALALRLGRGGASDGVQRGAVAYHEGQQHLVVDELRVRQDVPQNVFVRVHARDLVVTQRC